MDYIKIPPAIPIIIGLLLLLLRVVTVLLAKGGSPSLLFRLFYLVYLLSLNLESLIR